MARTPFQATRAAVTADRKEPLAPMYAATPSESEWAKSAATAEARAMADQAAADAAAERAAYQEQIGALRGLQAGAAERFAAARQPQIAAVEALGQRAGTLEGGAAMLQAQQGMEAAQARAMVAARSPYGGKGTSTESAILGGQIGQASAAGIGALEQEAAARQAAYLRGMQALGTGIMSEAEERRLLEQEAQRDMQARFLAAQRIAAGQQERAAASKQAQMGAMGQIGGTILGFAVGGPAGATIGGKAGGALGGS